MNTNTAHASGLDPNQPEGRRLIWFNIVFLSVTPILAAILVPWWALTQGIGVSHVAATLGLWILAGMGITAGYHRLFAHKAYAAPTFVRWIAAICGGAAWQGSAIRWSAGHRYHHKDVDTDKDPYDATRGFFWSHVGWICVEGTRHEQLDNVPDLWADPVCRFQHKYYMPLSVAFNLGVPLLLGVLLGDIWGMLLFGFLLRVVLVHHFTFFINSLAHMWGKRPYSTANTSRDNWIISLVTFGEGYHNYHHSFPADYRNGPRAWNFDPSKWLIWSTSKLGLATNLKRMPMETVVRRRLQEGQGAFGEWLEGLEERLAAGCERTKELYRSAQTHVGQASESLEASLEELKHAHHEWQQARQKKRAERPAAGELRDLRRAAKQATERVRVAMAEWERHLRESMGQALPASA